MALVVREIATGVGRTEGPVIRPNGEIVFVSMDQGKVYQIKGGKTSVLSDVGGQPNGLTEAKDGKIYVSQAGGKQWGPGAGIGGIQVIEPDGKTSWVSQVPIAPNDLCFGPDGLLYFTDPTRNRPTRDDGRLWRLNVETGEPDLLCSLPWSPNGIGFGLEDDLLYVASAIEHPGELQSGIFRFPIIKGGRLGKPEMIVRMPGTHRPDGFLFDTEGNFIIGANSNNKTDSETGEIQTYDKNGKLLDIFKPVKSGKSVTNVALADDGVLIISDTSNGKMLAVDNWPAKGLKLHPFRK